MNQDKTTVASDIQAMNQLFGDHWKSYQEIQHNEHIKRICERWPLLSETQRQRAAIKQNQAHD